MDECSKIFQSYRKDFFRKISLADVREIIKFETIIRSYLKMERLLNELRKTDETVA